jgi:hypothetical protein
MKVFAFPNRLGPHVLLRRFFCPGASFLAFLTPYVSGQVADKLVLTNGNEFVGQVKCIECEKGLHCL